MLQPIDILAAQLRDTQDELECLKSRPPPEPPTTIAAAFETRYNSHARADLQWSVKSGFPSSSSEITVDADRIHFHRSGVYLIILNINTRETNANGYPFAQPRRTEPPVLHKGDSGRWSIAIHIPDYSRSSSHIGCFETNDELAVENKGSSMAPAGSTLYIVLVQ